MPAYYPDQDPNNPRTFVQQAFQQPAHQAAATKRQLAYQAQPWQYKFTYNGLLPSSTSLSGWDSLENPAPVATAPGGTFTAGAMGGSVSLIVATLGTLDASNAVEVGFYLNGTSFADLYVPVAATWAGSTFYGYGDCVVGYTGFTAKAIQAGTSGGSGPTFASSIGGTVADGGVIWQTVSQSYASAAGKTAWYIPGYGDDRFQVKIVGYSGSTAADLVAKVLV